MIFKLGMYHWGLKLYKVYIIDDPELTLTVKIGETCFCTYSRHRYQVSVYRTIGPLVGSPHLQMGENWPWAFCLGWMRLMP